MGTKSDSSCQTVKAIFPLRFGDVIMMDDPVELAKKFIGTPVTVDGVTVGEVVFAEYEPEKNHIVYEYENHLKSKEEMVQELLESAREDLSVDTSHTRKIDVVTSSQLGFEVMDDGKQE